jgi:CheY-like chemotaxis protein
MNLVINAADAMPQGGTLTVSSSTDDGGTVTEKGEFVCLTVSDTGTGMDADTKSRLFEPFFTTKAIGKGTGLGLATVYGAIKRFGGDIRVESELQQGSRFHVYLPRSTHDRDQTEEVVGTESDMNHGAGHILVVEDDSGIAEMVRYILKNVGYRVDVVGTGLEALDFLKRQSELPDLILSDVMLPHMKGPELSREAHALYGEIRIAYMSGYRDLQAVDLRPDDGEILAKPFTRDELLQFVRRQLIPGNS